MAKKYTRKQLRQPDEFITMSHRAAGYVKDHAKMVLVSLSVAVVVIAAAWVWNWYRESQAKDATAMFTRAVEMYTQMVIPGAKDKLKPREDGIPHFETREAKLKAADEELSKVIARHGRSGVGLRALLMRGAVRYDQGKHAEAAADYEEYLGASKDERFRATAVEGLIYCYEADRKWDKALEQVKRLPADEDGRMLALYHEGRLLAAQGKKEEAIKRFRTVLDKSTSATLLQHAGQRLALLDTP